MKDIYMTLPFPPTVNSYYSKTQRGIYISKKGRLFREEVSQCAAEQSIYGLEIDPLLSVDVILYPPDRRTRDLDNYMKALLDSITVAKIWKDDSQICLLTVHRGVVIKQGKAEVKIQEHHGLILPDNQKVWDFID